MSEIGISISLEEGLQICILDAQNHIIHVEFQDASRTTGRLLSINGEPITSQPLYAGLFLESIITEIRLKPSRKRPTSSAPSSSESKHNIMFLPLAPGPLGIRVVPATASRTQECMGLVIVDKKSDILSNVTSDNSHTFTLQLADVLVGINGTDITKLTSSEAESLLKSLAGDTRRATLLRERVAPLRDTLGNDDAGMDGEDLNDDGWSGVKRRYITRHSSKPLFVNGKRLQLDLEQTTVHVMAPYAADPLADWRDNAYNITLKNIRKRAQRSMI